MTSLAVASHLLQTSAPRFLLKPLPPTDNQRTRFCLHHIFINQIKVEQALSSYCSSCQPQQQPLLWLPPPASAFFPAFPHVFPLALTSVS